MSDTSNRGKLSQFIQTKWSNEMIMEEIHTVNGILKIKSKKSVENCSVCNGFSPYLSQ